MSCGGKPTTAFKTAARRIFLTATDENDTSEKTQGGGGGALSNLVALAVRPFDGPYPHTHTHADIGLSLCGTFRDTKGKCKSEGRIWAADLSCRLRKFRNGSQDLWKHERTCCCCPMRHEWAGNRLINSSWISRGCRLVHKTFNAKMHFWTVWISKVLRWPEVLYSESPLCFFLLSFLSVIISRVNSTKFTEVCVCVYMSMWPCWYSSQFTLCKPLRVEMLSVL